MKKFLFMTAIAVVMAVNLFAVPADPRPQTIKQSNGKTLTYYVRGDERIHWCETIDGYKLLHNDNGELEYACVDEYGTFQVSGILACNPEERSEEELDFLKDISKDIFYSKEQTDQMRRRFR